MTGQTALIALGVVGALMVLLIMWIVAASLVEGAGGDAVDEQTGADWGLETASHNGDVLK